MKRKVIAITGKIGSGKSTVAGILRDLGYKTIDCDDLAKQVATEPSVVEQVEKLLGSKSVANGQLNRKAIREIVFGDENLLQKYQAIFFDGVKELLVTNIDSLQNITSAENDRQTIFVEIPVLNAFEFAWDEVWRVESSEKNCISRVTARDNVSADSVFATLNSQKNYDCTYVIENDGSLEQLKKSVHMILSEII